MHPFEEVLSVAEVDMDIELRGQELTPWTDFLLNPRHLRGSDFLMRWSQGQWSEERLIEAVNKTVDYYAIPFGPSGTASDNDVREFELYFERLESAGLGQLKRPDLLIFRKSDRHDVIQTIERIGGIQELPFVSEDQSEITSMLSKAILAVECENSLWIAKKCLIMVLS